jgi:hypothetical protein
MTLTLAFSYLGLKTFPFNAGDNLSNTPLVQGMKALGFYLNFQQTN